MLCGRPVLPQTVVTRTASFECMHALCIVYFLVIRSLLLKNMLGFSLLRKASIIIAYLKYKT